MIAHSSVTPYIQVKGKQDREREREGRRTRGRGIDSEHRVNKGVYCEGLESQKTLR